MGDNDKRKDELTKQLKSKMEELKKLRKKMTEDQDYGKDYANINKVKKLKSEIKTLKEDIKQIEENDKDQEKENDDKYSKYNNKYIETKQKINQINNRAKKQNKNIILNDEKSQVADIPQIEHKEVPLLEYHEKKEKEQESKEKDIPQIEHKDVPLLEYHDKKPIVSPNMAIEKTGLQIFREQFNQMPEIKKKHAIAETPFRGLLLGAPAVSSALVLAGIMTGGPLAWGITAAGAIAYAAYKPLMSRLTGQNKLEKQIEAQFMNMDHDEFMKMAKYLNEETIISLKPHAAILNALEKVAKTRCSQDVMRLKEEKNNLIELQERLENKSNKTIEEMRELANIGKRLKEIDGHGDKIGELAELYRIPKEIKRGSSRKSADHKGNMKGKKILNLLAKRNSTTKEYSKFINDEADAERAGDEEQYFADIERQNGNEEEALKRENQAAKFHNIQKDIFKRNTIVKHGISVGPANASDDGIAARIVSDEEDKTIQTTIAVATMTTALAQTVETMLNQIGAINLNADEAERLAQLYNGREDELVKNVEKLKQIGTVSKDDVVKSLMSEVATRANAGEQANLSQFGTSSYLNSGYVHADGMLNERLAQEVENIKNADLSNLKPKGLVDLIADSIERSGSAQQVTGQQLYGKTMLSGVDHAVNANVNLSSVEGKNIEAGLLRKFGNLMEEFEKFKPGGHISPNIKRLKNNFFGPAMSAMSAVIYKAKDTMDNHRESKDKKKQDRDNGIEI